MDQPDCIFCHPEQRPTQQVLFRNDHNLFIMQEEAQEVLAGSGIIIPKAHRTSLMELTEFEWGSAYRLLRRVKAYLDKEFQPSGYTIGWDLGETAGQDYPHIQMHVIPRYGDEPFHGRGIRNWIERKENARPGLDRSSGSSTP